VSVKNLNRKYPARPRNSSRPPADNIGNKQTNFWKCEARQSGLYSEIHKFYAEPHLSFPSNFTDGLRHYFKPGMQLACLAMTAGKFAAAVRT
jgi:hypothetical protein